MAKYLIRGSYTAEGTKGLIKDGGSGRKAAVERALQAMGGSVDAFYYAFGDTDIYIIVDIPDVVSATALSVVANSSGAVTAKITPLITVEQMDAACKMPSAYTAPGQ